MNRIMLVRMNDSRFAQEPNGSYDQYGHTLTHCAIYERLFSSEPGAAGNTNSASGNSQVNLTEIKISHHLPQPTTSVFPFPSMIFRVCMHTHEQNLFTTSSGFVRVSMSCGCTTRYEMSSDWGATHDCSRRKDVSRLTVGRVTIGSNMVTVLRQR
jgi:hypothetical protein